MGVVRGLRPLPAMGGTPRVQPAPHRDGPTDRQRMTSLAVVYPPVVRASPAQHDSLGSVKDELSVRSTNIRVRTTNRKQFFMPGELPLVLLALLSERSQSGYELLGELERRFAPHYRPSPGSVYPALSALRAEQLIEQESGGRKASYRVTAQGRQMLTYQRVVFARIEARTSAALNSATSRQLVLGRFVDR